MASIAKELERKVSQFKLPSQDQDFLNLSKHPKISEKTDTDSAQKSKQKGQNNFVTEFDEATDYQEPGEKEIES